MGREGPRSREDGSFSVGVDFPDVVSGRVGDVGVAHEVHGDVVRDLTCAGGGVVGWEKREEEAVA